jgi:hypothetical protein
MFRGYFARHTFLLFILATAAFFVTSTGAALTLYLVFAPNLSETSDASDTDTVKMLNQEQVTTPRLRVKAEETEPFSASEAEYSWTSGGSEARIKLDSDDDSSGSI